MVPKGNKWNYVPHIDQVLGKRDRIRIAGDGDGAIGDATLPIVAVRDTNHRTGDLSDFRYFGATFADDAPDELIGHRHLVCLLIRILGIAGVRTAQLRTGQGC